MVDSTRKQQIRKLITDFLQQRLADKLDKLALDDLKRDVLAEQYQRENWLADAARRVAQLQMVTHTLKATHSDAKGSSLFVVPKNMPERTVVGSHCLGQGYASDVVGNAAALDVYKFLKLVYDGSSLLGLMQAGDTDLLAALSDSAEQAGLWVSAFTAITESSDALSSHTRAKQVYWLKGYEPCDDSHYHLLAPLYASSLSHHVYQIIQGHRFGEDAKSARLARREGRLHPNGYSEYPHLAEEKKGGTKPQNVSQLNSERRGSNYLLASLPPMWTGSGLTPLLHSESALNRFGRIPEVRRAVRELRKFLENAPANNVTTRDQRDALLGAVFDELVLFSAEIINNITPGWSADVNCKLPIEEQCWLDPWRAADDPEFHETWRRRDWPQQVAERFARWLNNKLGDRLMAGDAEFKYWARELGGERDWRNLQEEPLHALRTIGMADREQGGEACAS